MDGTEEWRDVVGWPQYQVSSHGRVRSTIGGSRWPPMILKNLVTVHGYVRITLCHEGRRKRYTLHGLVCEAFHGPKPSKLHAVAHNDGDKLNNYYTNLRWATAKENNADKIRHGTINWGDKHGGNKLTEGDIPEIRALAASGWTRTDIASRYGVTRQCISFVVRRIWWRHVP